jgi:hypothetical protein
MDNGLKVCIENDQNNPLPRIQNGPTKNEASTELYIGLTIQLDLLNILVHQICFPYFER